MLGISYIQGEGDGAYSLALKMYKSLEKIKHKIESVGFCIMGGEQKTAKNYFILPVL